MSHNLANALPITVIPWLKSSYFLISNRLSEQGDNKAYRFATYGTWFADNGQFVDLIAKYSRLSIDFTVNQMAGSYDINAFSVSAEYG